MLHFVYGRDRAGAGPTRRALLKDHWAFMTPYIDRMVARGPTMSEDGRLPTGSLHIVDLADEDAVRVFAEADPLARGGVFEEIVVRGFENLTGRTMWQFAGDPANPRFLFVGEADAVPDVQADGIVAAQRTLLARPEAARAVIVAGPLRDPESGRWRGTAVLLEAPDRAAAEWLLAADPAASLYDRTALHRWRFGGAENLQDLIGGA
ncbi:YciI family protein [Rhodoplanes sp. TEM]|uniref:YciI family protein n=1 Tax=Rhodoplanes tepidamans TaxID=200616 RepID=A0ABT5JET4_RHOTP|nr:MULTISPECIES: YciI family protein [Rhodoplanes]MDC7788141.1 YciI family protein [Rhodoplanes tepidamans]MDC7984584.1 YciI family protein [Rhodoplanes sp. TEM]MDQ0355169.1 uncharacterized protein YciI [Rhodoplanes tepidamans]